jgi:hypothetical protein
MVCCCELLCTAAYRASHAVYRNGRLKSIDAMTAYLAVMWWMWYHHALLPHGMVAL